VLAKRFEPVKPINYQSFLILTRSIYTMRNLSLLLACSHFSCFCRVILLAFCLCFLGCSKERCKDDVLLIQQTPNHVQQIKLNGYYFGDTTTWGKPYANVLYFYRNGVFMYAFGKDKETAEAGAVVIDHEDYKSLKRAWGLYRIDGNTIEMERWGPSDYCGLTTIYDKGEIINDTMFVIKYFEERNRGKAKHREDINSYFFFRAAVKPDSTNNFHN
jgi:hypothetical protein